MHPSHPPRRSTPVLSHFIFLFQTNLAVLSNCSSTAFLSLLLFAFSCMAEPDWTLLTIPAVLGCLSSVWTWTLWKENVRICAENLRKCYQNNSLTPPMYTKNNVIKSILQIKRNGLQRSYNDYWYLWFKNNLKSRIRARCNWPQLLRCPCQRSFFLFVCLFFAEANKIK